MNSVVQFKQNESNLNPRKSIEVKELQCLLDKLRRTLTYLEQGGLIEKNELEREIQKLNTFSEKYDLKARAQNLC